MGVKLNILFFSLFIILIILTSGCETYPGSDKEPLLAPITCITYEGTPAQCTYAPIGSEDFDAYCQDGFFYRPEKTCVIKREIAVSEIPQPQYSVPVGSVKICCWPYACNDMLDNDEDGLADGDDEGCRYPPEVHNLNDPIEEIDCQDGFDNDGDGLVDEDDPGCYLWSLWENKYVYMPSRNHERGGRYACDNGIDDDEDEDGIDYKEDGTGDPQCQSPFDNNEEDTPGCWDPDEIPLGSGVCMDLWVCLGETFNLCEDEIYLWRDFTEDWMLKIDDHKMTIDCHGSKLLGPRIFKYGDRQLPGSALRASYIKNLTIKNCIFDGFSAGVDIDQSINLTIQNNEFSNGGYGLYVTGDRYNDKIFDVYNNNFINNSVSALYIYDYNNDPLNEIYHNNFIDNNIAIKLLGLEDVRLIKNNYIWGNYIMDNVVGIDLRNAISNSIEGNNLISLGKQDSFVCTNAHSNLGVNFCEVGTECGGLSCAFSESEDDNTLLLLHFDGNLIGAQGETPTAESSVINYPTYEYGQGAEITTGNYLAYLNTGNIIREKGTMEFIVIPYWGGSTLEVGLPFIEVKEDRDIYPKGYGIGTFYGDGSGSPHPNKYYLFFNARYDYGEWSFLEAQTFYGEDTIVETWEANSVHHVKVTWDFVDDKHLRLFVDGELVDEVNEKNCIGCDWTNFPPNTIGNFITVGTNLDGNKVINGIIDELRISDIAR